MDSNNKLIGSIYKDHKNLYNPDNNVSILSYLPFVPEVSIILGVEKVLALKIYYLIYIH